MADFAFGPVELYLVGFDGERPSPGVLSALMELIDSGLVRLLDLVLVTKSTTGEVTVTEIEEDSDAYGLAEVEFLASGIAAEEDIHELAESILPGASAALVALELVYARTLTERLASSGAVVLRAERIPAPVVNAVLEAAELN
ncbi:MULTISPECIES: DUF6325 family protein [unclassified Microbacterium]|uniref:DUF6325 family protein n=1 Tax=unclassified Microbacterium TaxID=2609290 RepID=UPI00214B5632|nr:MULTISPECIES: DUF6325 family protein [unclassified Microbacterium]MCR2808592.1 DUF6325 family protein [Microbacterium sp. zg.B185]WIM18970.1 DUF6325 family protein [Microbacterium sp. zg-B185]